MLDGCCYFSFWKFLTQNIYAHEISYEYLYLHIFCLSHIAISKYYVKREEPQFLMELLLSRKSIV